MIRDHRPGHAGRRLTAIVLAVGSAALATPWLTGTGTAQEALPVTLTLRDQTFTVAAGEMVAISFDVSGDLPRDVLPTTTTATSTTAPPRTTTTAPATQSDVEGVPVPGPVTTTTTTTTTTSTTTTTPATTTAPPVAGDVQVVVYPAISTRSQVADALAGDVRGGPLDGVQIDDLADQLTVRRRGDSRTVRLDVAVPVPAADISGEDDLELIEPGLYPVTVTMRIDESAVAEYTTLVRRVSDDPPPGLRLAVVAGALDDESGNDVEPMIDLAGGSTPLSVMIPPASLQQLEADRPRLLARLATALGGDEAVSLPTASMDPSSAASADLGHLFSDALSAGEDTLISLLPETPPRRTTWPLVDDVSTAGAELLSQLGVRIFVTDRAFATGKIEPLSLPLPGEQIGVPAGDRNVGALVVDADVARLVGERDQDRTPLQQAVELFATLTLDEVAAGGRGVVLATDGFGVPDPAVIEALGGLVDESPDAEFVTLSALPGFSDVESDTVLTLPETAGTDLAPRVTMIDSARFQLADTASMLDPGDPHQAAWDDLLDGLLTTTIDDAEALVTIAGMTAESDVIRAAIVPPEPFTFTLTGRTSEIRLRIGNTSDSVLRVKVVPTSPRLTFPDGPVLIDVPPGDPTLVPIRVSARSNGTSAVAISLRTPNDGELTEPVFLTARVNTLTGLSQVLTGGALLVLATWWLSHLRQRRRERRGLPTRRERRTAANGGDLQLSPDAAEAQAEPTPYDGGVVGNRQSDGEPPDR